MRGNGIKDSELREPAAATWLTVEPELGAAVEFPMESGYWPTTEFTQEALDDFVEVFNKVNSAEPA